MRSLSLGKLFGIEIELHWTFVLLFAFVLVSVLITEPAQFLPILTLLVFLFLSVFVHELSHSLMAQSKRVNVSKIMLLPIGGVSVSEELPENPKDEFLIAFVGPLFNFLVVIAVFIIASIFPSLFPWSVFQQPTSEGVQQALYSFPLFALFWVNLMLGVFNLFVPALPLDGGRVFRALLGMKLGYVKATDWTARLSVLIAIALFLYGLLAGGFLVMIIAVFVYLGAQHERDTAFFKESLKGFDFTHLIDPHPFILEGDLSLQTALQEMLARNQNAVLVRLPNGFGVVNFESFLSQKSKHGLDASLQSACTPVQAIPLKSAGLQSLQRFLTLGIELAPVIDEFNSLVGVIRLRDLEKHYQLVQLKKLLHAHF